MKAPTIKDIAKKAGVSQGTVSNVLNGRGNVSVEKILLVKSVADQLGYRINTKAQLLRKGEADTVLFISPGMRYPKYSVMYEVLQKELREHGYSAQMYSTNSLAVEEEAALNSAIMSRVTAVVAVIGLEPDNKFLKLVTNKIPVILVDNHAPANDKTILAGFDYSKSGRDIGAELNERKAKNVAVFTAPRSKTTVVDFIEELSGVFKGNLNIVYSTDQLVDTQAFSVFGTDDDLDFIIATDEYRRDAVSRAHSYISKKPMPPIITLSTFKAISDTDRINYELDYRTLAHHIVEKLFGEKEDIQLILPGKGIKKSIPLIKNQKHKTLEFLTVNSPSSLAISKLLPHFYKKTGIDVIPTVLGLEELHEKTKELNADSDYDLIRMDMAWIPELASKVYAPLEEVKSDWQNIEKNILPFFLEDYTSFKDVKYCLPYDPSTQILFYRKDIFEDPTIKRMYYEKHREMLTVPETFDDYNKVAQFFTREYNPESPVLYGTTTAIGNAVVSPSEYLPRLFGEQGELFDSNGHINLKTDEALKALYNYVQTHKYSDKIIYQWWKDALEGFSNGNVAMTIVYMNYASNIIISENSNIAGKIGFAMIPGKKPLIGGGVIGISRYSKKSAEAALFLDWLYSSEIAPAITMLGGLSPSKFAYKNRDSLDIYPWLLDAMQSFPIAHHRLHNEYYLDFSEKKLEDIISRYVKDAILGKITPEEALDYAQKECDEQFTH